MTRITNAKMAGVVLGNKPKNFIINWSEGAHPSQTNQVKANDPELKATKNSRIVPTEMFDELLIRNEEGNIEKGNDDQWQIYPSKLQLLKSRLASKYNLPISSILTYDEWDAKHHADDAPLKWNVIIAPGEPDITANTHGVLSTLLLQH